MNERVSIANHAIHWLNLVYHRRFFSSRRCNTDARGMPVLFNIYNHYAHCSTTCHWQVNLITIEQFKHWLANTDSEVTFIGKPLGDLSNLSKRNALTTMVTYCTKEAENLCGGSCTVYNGGATCIEIAAPGASCLLATNDVGICTLPGCATLSCTQYSECLMRINNGYCSAPGTRSILVDNF